MSNPENSKGNDLETLRGQIQKYKDRVARELLGFAIDEFGNDFVDSNNEEINQDDLVIHSPGTIVSGAYLYIIAPKSVVVDKEIYYRFQSKGKKVKKLRENFQMKIIDGDQQTKITLTDNAEGGVYRGRVYRYELTIKSKQDEKKKKRESELHIRGIYVGDNKRRDSRYVLKKISPQAVIVFAGCKAKVPEGEEWGGIMLFDDSEKPIGHYGQVDSDNWLGERKN